MRIALFWDEPLMAEAMAALLESKGHFQVVGFTGKARDCLMLVRNGRADAVVARAGLMRDESAGLLLGARLVGGFGLVIVGSDGTDRPEDDAKFVPSESDSPTLFAALRQAVPDVFPQRRSRLRRSSELGLSAREHEIAELVSKGLSNKRISELIGLREQTVKNMVSTVIRQLGCENRTQVALKLAAVAESRLSAPYQST